MADLDAVSIYVELSAAIGELQCRGLQHSVKWAAEQLVGLPEHAFEQGAKKAAEAAAHGLQPEHPRLIQGRSYFELKEYHRAAHVLSGVNTPAAAFLRCYALYLAGEKRKDEERIEASGPLGTAVTTNPHLEQVAAELEAASAAGLLAGDAFALFLQALLEIDRDHKDWARQLLVQSITAFPCHWGAWQALTGLCDDLECVSTLTLPVHWTRHYFLAALCLELQYNAEALSRLQVINQLFPGSDWVAASAALAHYNMRNFDEAQALYEDLLARDPARLAGMDTYSNILFVKEAFAPLSHLAHRLAGSDKYTPETCCVIGNYYSLKGQHERAVEYFRRALRLSRTYLSAWTLMGHEYVEMKNAPAAIDAYRSAVALNPRDYRAWYGLGQTYELLSMPYYALHYYRRAALLRPSDPRMWCALGHCYESDGLGMPGLAVRCYRRAVAHGDREGIALNRLAKLYEAQGDRRSAAHYYALNLARLDAERMQGNDVTEALLFLAEFAKDSCMLAEAEQYCQRLMDVGGPANIRAKAILRDMRSSSNRAAAAAATAAQAGRDNSSRGRAVLGPRPVLGNATAGGGGASWLLGQQQQQQHLYDAAAGYASPAAGNTPGNFSVAMDDESDEDLQDNQLDSELLEATARITPAAQRIPRPQQHATPGTTPGVLPTVAPGLDATLAAAAAAARGVQRGLEFTPGDTEMDMATPAPFAVPVVSAPQVRPPAAAADTGLALTPGVTPGATLGGAAAAAWRADLMHLLGPSFEQGAARSRMASQQGQQQQQQQSNTLDFTTPASDMDMYTPAATVAAPATAAADSGAGAGRGVVRGGLFATPEGMLATSPAAAAAGTTGATAARHGSGPAATAARAPPSVPPGIYVPPGAPRTINRRGGHGAASRRGSSAGSTAAAAAPGGGTGGTSTPTFAANVEHLCSMAGVSRAEAEAALEHYGGDLLQALVAVRQVQEGSPSTPTYSEH